MRVVHFSNNSLAGAPIRLCRALTAHAGVDARLVDLKRFGLYGQDVVFKETPELALELARTADVIHLHNFLDAESTDFAPIDFASLAKAGARLLRHFHSTPGLIALRRGISVDALLASPTPTVVIAQYPERLFPKAMVVPNLIPASDPAYRPNPGSPQWDVFFGPSRPGGAFEDRWNTKGAPETTAMLARLAAKTGARINARDGSSLAPLAQILAEKSRSRIVIDDLAHGSYHLSGLEGLCLGKPVLNFLDERTLFLLRAFSGQSEHPFCNVRLEEAEDVLAYLLAHPGEAEEIGAASRDWIDRCWSEPRLAGFYREMYAMLLDDPGRIVRQPELALDGPRRFFAVTLPELVHGARSRRFRHNETETI
ncbi:MAG: glycosyltransferase family 1 protein [Desulfovibrionaceae bacterium]|nr:glycosyltransferase family 1 protein [Desulfovibrionaceae bacterium]MBF0513873.1 glycosyltransferase family 1 protein [Desulfovibrionaceae bacterium]